MRSNSRNIAHILLLVCISHSSICFSQNTRDLSATERARIREDVKRAQEERRTSHSSFQIRNEKRDRESLERLRNDVPRLRPMEFKNK